MSTFSAGSQAHVQWVSDYDLHGQGLKVQQREFGGLGLGDLTIASLPFADDVSADHDFGSNSVLQPRKVRGPQSIAQEISSSG